MENIFSETCKTIFVVFFANPTFSRKDAKKSIKYLDIALYIVILRGRDMGEKKNQ